MYCMYIDCLVCSQLRLITIGPALERLTSPAYKTRQILDSCGHQCFAQNSNHSSAVATVSFRRGDRIFTQLDGLGDNLGSLGNVSCPLGQKIVGYAGLDTCDGPNLFQVRSDPCSIAASVKANLMNVTRQGQEEGLH